jgi:peptide/nickel transport system substrate-binding protein
MKKIYFIMVTFIVISFLVAGCGTSVTTPPGTSPAVSSPASTMPEVTSSSSPAASPSAGPTVSESDSKYGGVLRIIGPSMTNNIGWPASMMGGAFTDMQYCLETLLRGDNKGEVYPWLAESYKIAEDLKSITFTLRKDVKFHDGSDFNAAVAKWNLENMIQAHREPNWKSVDIIDDYTIRVNFSSWLNTLPGSFAEMNSTNVPFMISKAAFDQHDKAWMTANPVGTGPFKYVSFELDSKLVLTKNTDYWKKDDKGNQLPYLDGIERLVVVDSLTQNAMMKNGEGDVIRVETGKSGYDLAQMGLQVFASTDATYYLIPDTANANSPWAKVEVREAAEYAIDRNAIANAFGFGFMEAPYQIPARITNAYDPDFKLARKYDPDKAKQLLAAAGYPDGFSTTISSFPTASKDVVVAMQGYLDKVGIKATLDYPNIGRWISFSNGWPEGTILFSVVPSGDPNFIGGFDYLSSTIGKSWERTPEWVQSYQTITSSPRPDVNLIRQAADAMTREASIIPIIEGGSTHAAQAYVQIKLYNRGSTPFWNTEEVWLDK